MVRYPKAFHLLKNLLVGIASRSEPPETMRRPTERVLPVALSSILKGTMLRVVDANGDLS
jgi:hypothetical protein